MKRIDGQDSGIPRTRERVSDWISLLVLLGLLLLTALRPLIAESYDSGTSALSAAIAELADPTPVRTLGFDLVILGGFVVWIVSRRTEGSGLALCWTGLEAGLGVLAVAAILSCALAGNKRLALNASADWLCYPLLTILLVPLLDRTWKRQLLLAVVLASAGAQAVQCCDQYFVGFRDTWEHYQTVKADFWARQGVAADAPQVVLFENRMSAREASGFFPHSNVAGSYLILCGLAALGAAVDAGRVASSWGMRLRAVGCWAMTTLLFFAATLTKSRGAMVAGSVGIALFLGVYLFREWIARHRAKTFVYAWMGVGLGLIGVIAYGVVTGTLPGASLAFRWQYWTASLNMILDHPLFGVGRENFGRHYLQYKGIESPEEIANPHNLFVQFAAEWGIVGLLGFVALLVAGSWVLCVRNAGGTQRADAEFDNPRIWPLGLGLIAALSAARYWLLGTANLDYLFVCTVQTAAPWIAVLMILSPSVSRDGLPRRTEPAPPYPNRIGPSPPAHYAQLGAALGLFAFLLHDLINFAIFVPGTAMTFFALLAYCLAGSGTGIAKPNSVQLILDSAAQHDEAMNRRSWRLVLFSSRTLAITAFLAMVPLIPVVWSAGPLKRARSLATTVAPTRLEGHPAPQAYNEAAVADPLDPTPLVEWAEWLIRSPWPDDQLQPALRLGLDCLRRAAERDPKNVNIARLLSRTHLRLAARSGNRTDYDDAIRAARRALELYPLDPSGVVELADCLWASAEAASDLEWSKQAVTEYQRALALDDARPTWETIRRFPPRVRQEIEGKIRLGTSRLLNK